MTGRASTSRVRYVWLPAWWVYEGDGKLRLATEDEAVEARKQREKAARDA